jgi:hypothetical protein
VDNRLACHGLHLHEAAIPVLERLARGDTQTRLVLGKRDERSLLHRLHQLPPVILGDLGLSDLLIALGGDGLGEEVLVLLLEFRHLVHQLLRSALPRFNVHDSVTFLSAPAKAARRCNAKQRATGLMKVR